MESEMVVSVKPRLPHAFTRENAREMNRRAMEAIARKKAELASKLANALQPADEYAKDEIARTREQIGALRDKLDRARDAKDMKALSDAIWRMTEIERVLSGRPLPGSNKPSSPPRKAGSNGQISPLD